MLEVIENAHQPSLQNVSGCSPGSFLNTDPVVVEKRRKTEREGHASRGCWGHEQRKHPHQVRNQNQHRESHHYRKVFQSLGPDNVFDHATHSEYANLERLLSVPWFFFRKLSFE